MGRKKRAVTCSYCLGQAKLSPTERHNKAKCPWLKMLDMTQVDTDDVTAQHAWVCQVSKVSNVFLFFNNISLC